MDDAHGMGALNDMATRTVVLRSGDREFRASVDDSGIVSVDDAATVATEAAGAGVVRVRNGRERRGWVSAVGDTRWVFLDGEVFEFEVQRGGRRRAAAGPHASLSAPMPASVVRVDVAPGDRVRKGQTLVILEAMKMELPVRAPADGDVKAVHCRPGDLVKPGTPLIELE
jgi:biotin carboxyl carrier protein